MGVADLADAQNSVVNLEAGETEAIGLEDA